MNIALRAAAFLLAATTLTAQAPIESILSQDPVAYLTISPKAWHQHGPNTAISRIYHESEVQAFLEPLFWALDKQIDAFAPFLEAQVGLEFPEVLELLKASEIAACVSELNMISGTPVWQIVLRSASAPDVLARLVTHFTSQLEAEGFVEGSTKLGTGHTMYTISGIPEVGSAYLARHKSTIIVTSAVDNMTGILERIDGKTDGPSLATSDLYRLHTRNANPGESLLRLGCDVNALFQMFGDMDPEVGEALRAIGVDCIQSVGLGVALDGPGIRESFTIAAPQPSGILKILAVQPDATIKSDRWLPDNIAYYNAFNLPLSDTLNEVRRILDQLDPNASAEIAEALQGMRQAIGIDLEKDVLPALGSEIAFFAALPSQSLIPDLGLLLEVRDGEKLHGAIKKAVAATLGPDALSQFEFRGETIHSVRLFSPEQSNQWNVSVQKLYYATIDGFLVATVWPQVIKNLIVSREDADHRLINNQDYASQLDRLQNGDPSRGQLAREYLDVKRTAGFVLDNATPIAQLFLPGVLPDADFVDWAKIPTSRCITKHLFGLASISSYEDGVLSVSSHSPAGRMAMLAVPVALGGLWFAGLSYDESMAPADPFK